MQLGRHTWDWGAGKIVGGLGVFYSRNIERKVHVYVFLFYSLIFNGVDR